MKHLAAISIFVRVAESRTFTAAAQKLGISPSGVSKAVTRLEADLGVRLLNRTTRSVSLTDEGTILADRCRQILTDLEDTTAAITQNRDIPRGRLRVHMPVAFGRRIVVPALAKLADRYPELTVDVELSERYVDLAEEGIDATIRMGELRDSRLIARKLCQIRFVTCASPDYLRRHGQPETPEDLVNHRCLGYAIPQFGRYRDWIFTEDDQTISKDISGKLNINNSEALLDAAIEGAGIVSVSTLIAADAIQSGKLKIVLRDYISEGPPVSVVYLQSRHLSPRLRTFIDLLTELIPKNPIWDQIANG